MPETILPHIKETGIVTFTCPGCAAIAQQKVSSVGSNTTLGPREWTRLVRTECVACNHALLWSIPFLRATARDGAVGQLEPSYESAFVIYPDITALPACSRDTPKSATKFYYEAASVFGRSNRACATMIRVALEELFRDHFKRPGEKLGVIIDAYAKELGPIYKMAELLKLVGHDGAHPEVVTLDLDEASPDVIRALFQLFNTVCEKLITVPKQEAEILALVEGRTKQKIPTSTDEKVALRKANKETVSPGGTGSAV